MTTKIKDSGVKWIGSVPADWEINKIKYIATLKGRIGWQGLTSDEYTDEGAYLITGTDFENGGINWDSCVHVPMRRWDEARDIQIENGDLLITKDGTIGKVAIVSGCNAPTSLNSGVLRISTISGYDRKFLYWVLQSDVFWTWFADKNAGNSTIQHLYQGDFAEFKYAIPPIDEQRTIASFLDTECSKIDSIIDDLECQIEILEKQKHSLITETVLKGLDDSVSFSDTGIPWIGKIPSHWQVKQLKYITSLITKGATPEDISTFEDNSHPIRFLKAENLQNGCLFQKPEFFISESDNITLRRAALKDRDILFVIAGATIGKVAIMRKELCPCNLNQAVCLIRMDDMQSADYFAFVLQSNIISVVINLLTVQSAQPNLSMGNIANIKVPVPPIEEQKAIYNYLFNKCQKTDRIKMEKENQLNVIKNHKKSLIYEYVTGKKRVKEVTNYAN